MAELVDALVSGASVERRAGSSPVLGTTCSIKEQVILENTSEKLIVSRTQKTNEGFVSPS